MKKIWIVLLVLCGFCMLWFLGKAALDCIEYLSLDVKTRAKVHDWTVKELRGSKFGILASYTYEGRGRKYEADFLLKPPYFLNRISAEKEIEKLAVGSWQVWYQSKKPDRSALQKSFPLKKIFDFVVVFGVFAYFVSLALKQHSQKNFI